MDISKWEQAATGSPSRQRYPEGRKQPIILVLGRDCSVASDPLLLFLTRKSTHKSYHFVRTSIRGPEILNAINTSLKFTNPIFFRFRNNT